MNAVCRLLAACALAALPALCCGQGAAVKPDGRVGYGWAGGASYLSGTTVLSRSVHLGGDAAMATPDNQWRIGCKALWSRSEGESTAENVTVLLTQESRHRWNRQTWFWEKLSLFPAVRAGDNVRASLDTGLAIGLNRLLHIDIGLTQRYDGAPGARGDTRIVGGIAMKLE